MLVQIKLKKSVVPKYQRNAYHARRKEINEKNTGFHQKVETTHQLFWSWSFVRTISNCRVDVNCVILFFVFSLRCQGMMNEHRRLASSGFCISVLNAHFCVFFSLSIQCIKQNKNEKIFVFRLYFYYSVLNWIHRW